MDDETNNASRASVLEGSELLRGFRGRRTSLLHLSNAVIQKLIALVSIFGVFFLFAPPPTVYAATVRFDATAFATGASITSITTTLPIGPAGTGNRLVYAAVFCCGDLDQLNGIAIDGVMMRQVGKDLSTSNFISLYLYNLVTQSTTTASNIIVASTSASSATLEIVAASYIGAQPFGQLTGARVVVTGAATIVNCRMGTTTLNDGYVGVVVNSGVAESATTPHLVNVMAGTRRFIDFIGTPATPPGYVTISASSATNASWDAVCSTIHVAADQPYFPF